MSDDRPSKDRRPEKELSDRVVERLRRIAVAKESAFPPHEGDVVDERFELIETIGSGASGVVFRARDREHDTEVALKAVFWKEAWDDGRFAREAAALEALAAHDHPAIVRYIAHGELGGGAGYLVTELLTGRTLAERLRESEPSIDQSLELCARIAGGLAVVHAAGIVHRDIKPSNIFVCDDDFTAAKIIDFGIARREGASELTRTGAIIGTPGYLAPEQARSREAVGPATDVFALGCLLFRCVTGHSPFEGDDVLSVALRTVLDDAPRVSSRREGVSDALDRLVASMLAKDPAARPASGEDLVRRLERVRRAKPTPAWRKAIRARGWVGLVILGTAALLLLLAPLLREPVGREIELPPLRANANRVIAVLPFEDQTNEPRLDFSAAGLAYLVGAELRGVPDVATLGYYRLARDVPAPDAPREKWLEAARAAGATLILSGRLVRTAEGIESSLALTQLDGQPIAQSKRVSDVEGVPDAVRACVDELALSLGAPQKPRGRRSAALTVERATQLAVAEIEQYRLGPAREHLNAALVADPNAAEAHYWLAVVNWWEHQEANALRSIDLALAGELDEPRRGFLEALKNLIGKDHAAAMGKLRLLAAKYPDDRDILYGLSEAYFHSGEHDRGVETYRALVASWPRFRLGMFHVFDRYRIRGDADGLAWVLARCDEDQRALWAPRAKIAVRDYQGAIELYSAALEGRAEGTDLYWDIKREIVAAHALLGQLSLAETLAEELRSHHPIYGAAALHGLAAARGKRAAEKRFAEALVRDARSRPPSEERYEILAPLGLGKATVGLGEVPEIEREIADAVRGSFLDKSERIAAFELMLAATRDRGPTEHKGTAAEAAARALELERAGRHEEAGRAWLRAADLVAWPEIHASYRFFSARAFRAAKRHEDVLSACDEVTRPRVFSWIWGGLVGQCLAWQVEAAQVLGRQPIAKQAFERLLSMRSEGDPLVAEARKKIDAAD